MNKLAAVETQSDRDNGSSAKAAADEASSRLVARVRRLMIISGLTTLIAIAAVASVIGYRIFRAGAGAAVVGADEIVALPKGAHIIATAAADDRLVVTLDVAGAVEIRTFDIKTLKETGRIRFAIEP